MLTLINLSSRLMGANYPFTLKTLKIKIFKQINASSKLQVIKGSIVIYIIQQLKIFIVRR